MKIIYYHRILSNLLENLFLKTGKPLKTITSVYPMFWKCYENSFGALDENVMDMKTLKRRMLYK